MKLDLQHFLPPKNQHGLFNAAFFDFRTLAMDAVVGRLARSACKGIEWGGAAPPPQLPCGEAALRCSPPR